jgi:hypothetical protein
MQVKSAMMVLMMMIQIVVMMTAHSHFAEIQLFNSLTVKELAE